MTSVKNFSKPSTFSLCPDFCKTRLRLPDVIGRVPKTRRAIEFRRNFLGALDMGASPISRIAKEGASSPGRAKGMDGHRNALGRALARVSPLSLSKPPPERKLFCTRFLELGPGDFPFWLWLCQPLHLALRHQTLGKIRIPNKEIKNSFAKRYRIILTIGYSYRKSTIGLCDR